MRKPLSCGPVGEGIAFSFSPGDSGCHKAGYDVSLKSEGKIGLGANLDASSNIGPNSSSADVSMHVPGTKLNLGLSVENGHFSEVEPSLVFGESAFIGGGAVYYW